MQLELPVIEKLPNARSNSSRMPSRLLKLRLLFVNDK
jgi:hypothetical protein